MCLVLIQSGRAEIVALFVFSLSFGLSQNKYQSVTTIIVHFLLLLKSKQVSCLFPSVLVFSTITITRSKTLSFDNLEKSQRRPCLVYCHSSIANRTHSRLSSTSEITLFSPQIPTSVSLSFLFFGILNWARIGFRMCLIKHLLYWQYVVAVFGIRIYIDTL